MSKQKYLECACVVSTHGVRGTLRLECRCDTPQTLARLPKMYIHHAQNGTWRELRLRCASVQKNMVLASFEGIDSLEAAIPYKNTVLYADRDDFHLPPGIHFIADLLGLPVIDEKLGKVGSLCDVRTPAGQEIYEIRRPDGSTFLLPAVPAFVKNVSLGDPEDNCPAGIYVALIDGMME